MATSNRNSAITPAQAGPHESKKRRVDVVVDTNPIQRVALYARVSTVKDQSPEMQLRELRKYASRRGWTVQAEYADHGVSGSKDTRPQLNRLMSAAHRREFDAILCWKIDRFGRSLKHLVNALEDLGALGVAFVSLGDNLDLSTPSGRLMFHVIGAMAQFERELIHERVRSGIANAQAKGVRMGRAQRARGCQQLGYAAAGGPLMVGGMPGARRYQRGRRRGPHRASPGTF